MRLDYARERKICWHWSKIVWVDKATLVKQTIAVTIITVVLAVIISVFDSAILEGINLLVK